MSGESDNVYKSRFLAIKENGSIAISDGVGLCGVVESQEAKEIKSALDKVLSERE